jgi:CPA2 family monovalent cation:H+ antiporter-2
VSDAAAGQQVVSPPQPAETRPRHVIVVGFGLSGRSVVNNVIEQGVSYTVIETNPVTVNRCVPGGLKIIEGDARKPDVLRRAGIERATDVAVTMPNDSIVLEIVGQARHMNPTVRIIARCTFVSGGMEAHKRGADETVISEQVVANEFGRAISASLTRS